MYRSILFSAVGVSPINTFKLLKCYNFLKILIYHLTKPITWLQAFWSFVIMETFFRLAPKFRLSRIDYFGMNGTFLLKPGRLTSAIGALVFYSGAVFWVSLYKALIRKNKVPTTFFKIMFGTSLFLFTSFLVMPIAGIVNPQMRRGVLKKPGILGLGLDGWKTPISNLLAHLLFASFISNRRDK